MSQIAMEMAVRTLLNGIDPDPDREGLKDTPSRVVRSLREMTMGNWRDAAGILSTTFDEPCDEMVVCRGIPFTSLCEHHVLPFRGVADVGYIPAGRVVGLSKLARVVDCFAQRLQIQERLTEQIATAIDASLSPLGVGVVIRSEHLCMACRGVRKPGAEMVTSSLLGRMKTDASARAEFLALSSGR